MAFVVTNPTGAVRAWGSGPHRLQVVNFAAASGDTTGTITADSLIEIRAVIIGGGLVQTAQPSFAAGDNTCTIAFADPLATVSGQILCIGV